VIINRAASIARSLPKGLSRQMSSPGKEGGRPIPRNKLQEVIAITCVGIGVIGVVGGGIKGGMDAHEVVGDFVKDKKWSPTAKRAAKISATAGGVFGGAIAGGLTAAVICSGNIIFIAL
jgi:hypothetical protein